MVSKKTEFFADTTLEAAIPKAGRRRAGIDFQYGCI